MKESQLPKMMVMSSKSAKKVLRLKTSWIIKVLFEVP